MFNPTSAYSGFTVDDLATAKAFYTDTLGLTVEERVGGMKIQLPDGHVVWAYPRSNHQPTTYTMLNFVVDDIDEAVDELTHRGVRFVRYDDMPMQQDKKGIMRGRSQHTGPDIAWFNDPAGNTLAVLQEAD